MKRISIVLLGLLAVLATAAQAQTNSLLLARSGEHDYRITDRSKIDEVSSRLDRANVPKDDTLPHRLAIYQKQHNLPMTGALDKQTADSLGLNLDHIVAQSPKASDGDKEALGKDIGNFAGKVYNSAKEGGKRVGQSAQDFGQGVKQGVQEQTK